MGDHWNDIRKPRTIKPKHMNTENPAFRAIKKWLKNLTKITLFTICFLLILGLDYANLRPSIVYAVFFAMLSNVYEQLRKLNKSIRFTVKL